MRRRSSKLTIAFIIGSAAFPRALRRRSGDWASLRTRGNSALLETGLFWGGRPRFGDRTLLRYRDWSADGSVAMSVFTEAELQYLAGGRQLGRIATVGADGTPHVVPVGWIYNAARDTIEIGGRELEQSKKFRDVARTGRAAIVIDDLESTDPWRPRGIEVRGRAEAITMPTPLIQIYPERIVSWGLGQSRSARTVAS
jgi:pyridoxamine 5'-phosphate oxidase family protein